MTINTIGDSRFISHNPKIMIKSWIFDPPYNIGFKYNSKVNDSLSLSD